MNIAARSNAEILEQQYALWRKDPSSVEATWASFFEGFEIGMAQEVVVDEQGQSSGGSTGVDMVGAGASAGVAGVAGAASASAASSIDSSDVTGQSLNEEQLFFRARIVSMVQNFRSLGHTEAWVDPLSSEAPEEEDLSLAALGFEKGDLDEMVKTSFYRGGESMSLGDMIESLRSDYCQKIGFEFMHIHNKEVQQWITQKVEEQTRIGDLSNDQAVQNYRWVTEAECFEEFLHKKYVGQKRFSLEGGESLLAALNTVFEASPENGIKEIVMGMAHRGRLNVLANFMEKPLKVLLYEFSENYVPDMVSGDGDVKYHLGFEKNRKNKDGKVVAIDLAANPSHLEAVNSVVQGKARARQRSIGDEGERSKVLPILIHGDAAFAGQGSVAEVLNLSQLPGYQTGGTIHIVINNQIGFTTSPVDARSSDYCTDVAKMIEAPVFHVNGDCPREVSIVAQLALEFRQKFARDVVIDIVCYRRHGHNEGDEPSFTQPIFAKAIKNHATVSDVYGKQLAQEGVLSEEEAANITDKYFDRMEKELSELKEIEEKKKGGRIKVTELKGTTGIDQPSYSHETVVTGINSRTFKSLGKKLNEVPEGFRMHPTIEKRFLQSRIDAVANSGPYDWGHAEAMAFASLLNEGNPVRLSGQDSRRGTFSHRHSTYYDTETRERYMPLRNLSKKQAKFCVYNSLLSEAGVLGFDYGYSLMVPDMLIMWEAQFGDFANGAQVIIDQFICSAESKWSQPSGVVLLLPHGYEGMGPEHSSARIERFLQLCAEDNMQICNLTKPHQFFHVLRRQMRRPFRKPLVVFTPKSLLRHPEAVSSEEEMTGKTHFQEILDDDQLVDSPNRVTRLIFCSGKVYYDLLKYRNENEIKNAAIIRFEQVYPFHRERLKEIAKRYERANKKWVWCQEEPLNMGAWSFIGPRLEKACGSKVRYAGRSAASSPATGAKAVHVREQQKLVEQAFSV